MAHITSVGPTTSGFTTLRPSRRRSSVGTLGSQLKAALEHASRLTEMYGTDNPDTIVAWETVKVMLQSHPYFSTLVVSGWRVEEGV
jgi:hypothetical protein